MLLPVSRTMQITTSKETEFAHAGAPFHFRMTDGPRHHSRNLVHIWRDNKGEGVALVGLEEQNSGKVLLVLLLLLPHLLHNVNDTNVFKRRNKIHLK